MNVIDQSLLDITSLKVQGATNVALTVLDTLETLIHQTPDIAVASLQEIGKQLAYARPTEPLAQNAVRYIFSNPTNQILPNIQEFRAFIEKGKESIPENGKPLILKNGTYLTLCHSSTTVSLFQKAHESGTKFRLFVAETRPRFQGRITAKEVLDIGLDDVTMVVDTVALSLLEGQGEKIDAVFIGADLLSHTGFVNKIGSLSVAVAANRHDIPVYSLSTLLKFDPRTFEPKMIETRSPDEIWKDAPKNLKFFSPAFDFVPYFPNVHIICEEGVIKGEAVKDAVQKHFPFVLDINNPA
ncbi:MAG: hypothetical protein AAB937_01360 [Patescibacteria group bacterium]